MKCTRVGLKVISARVQARLAELDVGPAAGEDSDFSHAGHSLGERKRERKEERKEERKKERKSNATKSGTYLVWGPGNTENRERRGRVSCPLITLQVQVLQINVANKHYVLH